MATTEHEFSLWDGVSQDGSHSLNSSILEADDHDMSAVETMSNTSREDTAAMLEIALRRNLKLDEEEEEDTTARNGFYELKAEELQSEDPRTLPGYQEVPDNCPTWKRAMIDKKNKQIEEDAKKTLLAAREEEERWKGVPEWKKKILLEKQKKKCEDEDQQAMTEEQAAKLASMPDWKREILRKKRGDV